MRALLAGLVAMVMAVAVAPGAAHAEFGFLPGSLKVGALDKDGRPDLRAGVSPDRFIANFAFNAKDGKVEANVKDVIIDLTPGTIGYGSAVPACERPKLARWECPPETQVGLMRGKFVDLGDVDMPIYNMVPNAGEASDFGGMAIIMPLYMATPVRTTDGRVHTSIELRDLPQSLAMLSAEVEFWGVPADHQSDPLTGAPLGGPRRTLLATGTRCDVTPTTRIRYRTWAEPERWVTATTSEPGPLTGCSELSFDPGLGLTVDAPVADSPTGAAVTLTIPQIDDPDRRLTSQLREAVITLPEGMSLSPSVADGLMPCDDSQFGLEDNAAPACPAASKLGSVEVTSPALGVPMQGEFFFGRRLARDSYRLLITVEGPGFTLKIPGSLQIDPMTGRLTTILSNLPELPLSRLTLRFKGGPRAPLVTSASCGTGTASAVLTPYSGGRVPTVTASVTIGSAPGGGACPALAPFAPSFTAGTSPAVSGASSVFSLTVRRPDGDEALGRLQIPLPAGLSARLAAVPRCPMAVATAMACPAASRIGSLAVEAGAGANPFPLAGDVHLTGAYRDASMGVALTLRALAGPLDLGTVVVPGTLRMDPLDGHLTIAIDPLPTILDGVPLRLRTLRVDIDRPDFLINPTACSASRITATIRGAVAATAAATVPYVLRGCRALRFEPKLSVAVTGGRELRRGGHPGVSITMRQRARDANARAATVTLPKAVRLDEDAISVICARQRATDNRCPSASRVGTASVTTPLLAEPLTGSVYVVRPEGNGKPDLWAMFSGSGVRITLRAATVAKKGQAVRAEFTDLPDLPISSLTLRLRGGKGGVLSGAESFCSKRRARRITAQGALVGHNGARSTRTVRVSARPRCRG
jgi:hypothetical protein